MTIVASRGTPQFLIRIGGDLRDTIENAAGENGRSLNSEMVARIAAHLGDWQGSDPSKTNRLYADRRPTSIRFPEGMRERVKAAAKASGRSMNSEIMAALKGAPSTRPPQRRSFNLSVPDPW